MERFIAFVRFVPLERRVGDRVFACVKDILSYYFIEEKRYSSYNMLNC
jgi:hypothetical protein